MRSPCCQPNEVSRPLPMTVVEALASLAQSRMYYYSVPSHLPSVGGTNSLDRVFRTNVQHWQHARPPLEGLGWGRRVEIPADD
jgi:hypothetical protein